MDDLDKIYRHITLVQQNVKLLADRLRERNKAGDEILAWQIMAEGMKHDVSKFNGIERLYLNEETKQKHPDRFKLALEQHQSSNPHHPEFWKNGILDMTNVHLAEMVCDWYARSIEFGTDLRSWVNDVALPKYKIKPNSKKGKIIQTFINLLLDKPFN